MYYDHRQYYEDSGGMKAGNKSDLFICNLINCHKNDCTLRISTKTKFM